jgi:hypothetical protein
VVCLPTKGIRYAELQRHGKLSSILTPLNTSILTLCVKLCKIFKLEYLNGCKIGVLIFIALLETYLSNVHQIIKKFGSESWGWAWQLTVNNALNGCLWMAKNNQDKQGGEQGESCEQPALSICSFPSPLFKRHPETLPKLV